MPVAVVWFAPGTMSSVIPSKFIAALAWGISAPPLTVDDIILKPLGGDGMLF
jgi:hypothetical protein